MNIPNNDLIKTLKKELTFSIVDANYNLLTPEILALSRQLDDLMNPLFKSQLESSPISNPINF
ncbi:aspartyl-phosphate phosphatase Spo0E family protein [Cellulosilyticum sp. I15G10I2]|uniref:aspartyl-phosphate phosphatase Spo0E family protein n=1 Tax=Cellulosilyticum sp. I15G10I2 TaxID=1892843 RepID=UPI00085C1726|nr:aspartyl-phosphate phosphatase Spo0E family protein [Cellulosilyticum sp. I15G10I2]